MNMSLLTNVVELPRVILLIPQNVRFWIYVFFDIFSIICTLFTLYFLLIDRTLRHALNNHIIIVLLIVGLIYESTSIPWFLYNDYNRTPLIKSKIFYQFWTFLNYPLTVLQTELFAWASIERHTLIFHDQWVSTSKKRFFVHYLPIIIIIFYYTIYYSIVFFAPICEPSFDSLLAGGSYIPCVFDHTVLGVWDVSFHQLVPILIIVIFSTALLIRSIRQKSRLHQRINWRKYRKMIIQLLSVSIIYILFRAPLIFIIFAYQFGLPDNIARPILTYASFLSYYVTFLLPFVCCLSLPELRQKLTNVLHCRRTRRVAQVTGVPAHVPAAAIAETLRK